MESAEWRKKMFFEGTKCGKTGTQRPTPKGPATWEFYLSVKKEGTTA